jgi:hypothetical protein
LGNDDGRVFAREDIIAENGEEAVLSATQLQNGYAIEVWHCPWLERAIAPSGYFARLICLREYAHLKRRQSIVTVLPVGNLVFHAAVIAAGCATVAAVAALLFLQ